MSDLLFVIDSIARWILLFLLLVNVILVIKPVLRNYTSNQSLFPTFLTYAAYFNLVSAFTLFFWGPKGMITLMDNGMGMKNISTHSSISQLLISQMGMILISLLLIILYKCISKKEMPLREKYMMMSYLYITVFSILMVTHPLHIAQREGENIGIALFFH